MAEYKDTTPIYPSIPPGYNATVVAQPQIVVVSQVSGGSVPLGKHGVPLNQYQVGLCECCHSPMNCLCAYFCPCSMACRAAKKLEENSCYPIMFGSHGLAIRFRTLVGIQDSMCNEACTFCWCPCCATLRLVNEMEERNFDMHRC